MKDPQLAGRIVDAVCRKISLPVTVKIRAGWDKDSINAPEMAKILEQAGAALICIHGRTREQLYAPSADWKIIEQVKKSVRIPVVGNGDVCSADDVLRMARETGCDGVMIGRGAMGNPWIFEETIAVMEGKTYMLPSVAQRLVIAEEHLDGMLLHKGDRVGFAEAKKHMAWYLSGMRGAATARGAIMNASSADDIRDVFARLRLMSEEGAQ